MKGNIFIKRPVMAISISVLILVIGLISLFTLPVEQYPTLRLPQSICKASYTGRRCRSSDEQRHHAAGREHQRVEDMMYITSSASNAGSAIIQVYFKQGTDPDMAAVNVQNRVAKAQGFARRSNQSRSHDETTDQLPANRRFGLQWRSLRSDVPCQLSGHQRHPAIKRIEGGRRHGAGRYLQYAYLAETGTDGNNTDWFLRISPPYWASRTLKPLPAHWVRVQECLPVHDEISRKTEERGRVSETVVRSGRRFRYPSERCGRCGTGYTWRLWFRSEMDVSLPFYGDLPDSRFHAPLSTKEITAQMERMEKPRKVRSSSPWWVQRLPFRFHTQRGGNTDYRHHSGHPSWYISSCRIWRVRWFPSISIIVSLIGTFACLVAAGFSLNILTLFALC